MRAEHESAPIRSTPCAQYLQSGLRQRDLVREAILGSLRSYAPCRAIKARLLHVMAATSSRRWPVRMSKRTIAP